MFAEAGSLPSPELLAVLRRLGATLHATTPQAGDVVQIGLLAGLPCWHVTSTRDVAPTARRHARRGQCGLVMATAENDRAVLAASVTPVRVCTTALDHAALAWRRLAAAAATPRPTPLEQLVAFADALDTDRAGRRTFGMLRRLLDCGVAQLPARVPVDDRLQWMLLQVTRLLFLRFVESEGWLDARTTFLRDEFDRCLTARRDPARHLLHPLFFGTLNRPATRRSRLARAFGAVPFLNGGMFEPHAIERRHALELPVDFWCEVFDAIVDRIEVSLDAAGDTEAVTPEMLGTVFEGVMLPAERRHAGAFYTPTALVDAVLRAALAAHVSLRLGRRESAVERALDDPDPELRRALLSVNVLDPAVGSGAFLVGALGLLHGPGRRVPGRIRHLVTRRLHGVDRHPGAVRLCEMRLWLEVLRAMRGGAPEWVSPLPNLDATIRTGDVITDPLLAFPVPGGTLARLRARQRDIPAVHDAAHRKAVRALRHEERDALIVALTAREHALRRMIDDVASAATAPTLFGDHGAVTPHARRTLRQLRQDRRDTSRELQRIEDDAVAAPFVLATAFAPVLARRGGFDLVVGNPPWVRGQQLPTATRTMLASRYRWWKSAGAGAWAQLPDLAVAFLERAHESLAPGGTMAMLVPSKVVTATYAATARAAMANHLTIHRVADLADDPRARFDATTYPLALVATRQPPRSRHRVRLGLASDAPSVAQADWRGAETWSVAEPAAQQIRHRLRADVPVLRSRYRPQLGVKTGLNAAFIDPPEALHGWCVDAIRGADIAPFRVTGHCKLAWPADARGVPWRTLPAAIARHLAPFEARLRARADCTGPWWQLFRVEAATAAHRVAWSDLAHTLAAVSLDTGTAVPLNSCYVIATQSADDARALAAWLNSTWIRALARTTAEPAANGYARYAARVVATLPAPPHARESDALADAARRGASGSDVQAEIDEHVATALALSPSDRAVLARLAAHRR